MGDLQGILRKKDHAGFLLQGQFSVLVIPIWPVPNQAFPYSRYP